MSIFEKLITKLLEIFILVLIVCGTIFAILFTIAVGMKVLG